MRNLCMGTTGTPLQYVIIVLTCTYLYLWMMDHRSISFRAGPYHLASSWRSWLMVLLRCVAARSSSCWRLFERRNFLESSLQCLLYSFRLCPLVCWLDSASWKKVLLSTFLFQTESWMFRWDHLWFCVSSMLSVPRCV